MATCGACKSKSFDRYEISADRCCNAEILESPQASVQWHIVVLLFVSCETDNFLYLLDREFGCLLLVGGKVAYSNVDVGELVHELLVERLDGLLD